jgi:hypothetical protein
MKRSYRDLREELRASEKYAQDVAAYAAKIRAAGLEDASPADLPREYREEFLRLTAETLPHVSPQERAVLEAEAAKLKKLSAN